MMQPPLEWSTLNGCGPINYHARKEAIYGNFTKRGVSQILIIDDTLVEQCTVKNDKIFLLQKQIYSGPTLKRRRTTSQFSLGTAPSLNVTYSTCTIKRWISIILNCKNNKPEITNKNQFTKVFINKHSTRNTCQEIFN